MKPYVICHMMTTVDGRILPDRGSLLSGTTASTKTFTANWRATPGSSAA